MNNRTLVCPYCKTALQPGDDVVVCSDCNMPHHKACWVENRGCTTFGCLGAIDTPGSAPAADAPADEDDFEITFYGDIVIGNVVCERCGWLNDAGFAYCCYCGAPLEKEARNDDGQ